MFLWVPLTFSGAPGTYGDVIKGTMASQITRLTIVYSTIYSGADYRKHQNSTSLAFVRGFHWWPVNSWHKGPVAWKMFPLDDVIMNIQGILTGMFWRCLYWSYVQSPSCASMRLIDIDIFHVTHKSIGLSVTWKTTWIAIIWETLNWMWKSISQAVTVPLFTFIYTWLCM